MPKTSIKCATCRKELREKCDYYRFTCMCDEEVRVIHKDDIWISEYSYMVFADTEVPAVISN